MKTVITITKTVQTGIDSYKDIHISKMFDDNTTIKGIKIWIDSNYDKNLNINDIRISECTISDMPD